MTIQSLVLNEIPGILHGFGTQDEPLPQVMNKYWGLRPNWKQVHGDQWSEVKAPHQECGQVDALFTQTPGIPIGVMTADCVPILLAHESGSQVAAIHAGWRGTQSRILEKLWSDLQARGNYASQWVACIGPSISSCCYEVSEELADSFKKEFQELPSQSFLPKSRYLDLARIHEQILQRLGFKKVERLPYCTRCSQAPQFHSFRREGAGHRQWSTLLIQ
jgi:polyphenol oxidase